MGTTCSTYIQIHMKQVRMKLLQITSLHAPYNFQWSKNSLYVSRIISRHWSHSIEDSTFSYLYVRICRSRLWNRINLICNSIEKITIVQCNHLYPNYLLHYFSIFSLLCLTLISICKSVISLCVGSRNKLFFSDVRFFSCSNCTTL